MAMSKTAALAAARKSVTQINRRSGTDYVFYDCGGPDQGYSEEIRKNSYTMALLSRSKCVAVNALAYMGKTTDDSTWAVQTQADDHYASHTAAALLDAGLASLK